MLKPDYAKAQELILSNDAFFFLYQDEPPLDDLNLEEALEIAGYFPTGYIIKEGWEYVDDDMIEATFIPLVEEPEDFDAQQEMAKGYFAQIKLTQENTHVKLWFYRASTNKREYRGEYALRLNSVGKEVGFATGDWRKGKGCLLWLKHFKEVKPGKLRSLPNLPQGL